MPQSLLNTLAIFRILIVIRKMKSSSRVKINTFCRTGILSLQICAASSGSIFWCLCPFVLILDLSTLESWLGVGSAVVSPPLIPNKEIYKLIKPTAFFTPCSTMLTESETNTVKTNRFKLGLPLLTEATPAASLLSDSSTTPISPSILTDE